MAFDATLPATTIAAPRAHFLRSERLVVLMGATCAGAVAGFAVAMSVGRLDLVVMALVAIVALGFAAHLTIQTFSEALAARAYGCATASALHIGALMAWPMIALFAATAPALYWLAPATALSALVLFASCWGGSARAVYRASAQGALVAAIAAQQGVTVLLG